MSEPKRAAAKPVEGASGDAPVRGRGGFRHVELKTIPENIMSTRAENIAQFHKVQLYANYVPIKPMPNRAIQMYRVDFEPNVESASKMSFLFKTAARSLFDKLPIYDGVHECRSSQLLSDTTTSVPISDPKDNAEYTIKFTHTGQCAHGSEMLRNYNMQMNRFLIDMGYYSPQPGLFVHPNQYDQVDRDIMLLKGFRTAANMHDGNKMLMNLEAAHKIVQRENVLQYISRLGYENRNRGNLQEILRQNLEGKLVVTAYNKRCYRVEEIEFETNPQDTFSHKGEEKTFIEFYKTAHNITIEDPKQPLLRVVPSNKRSRVDDTRVTLLVPELCNIAGLTERQRNDDQLKRKLIAASQVSPSDRVKQLRKFLEEFHANDKVKTQLSSWGYSYGNEPVTLQAHVISPTGYNCGNVKPDAKVNYTKADLNTSDIRVNGLVLVPKIARMVFISPNNRDKQRIINTLKEGFDRVKLVYNCEEKDLNSEREIDYMRAIRELSPNPTIAIVVMRRQEKVLYDAIKKAASNERGIITQVVTATVLMGQRARSAAQKIAIQVAAKVGGEPWWTDIPLRGTMVCGYDAYHDTATRGNSFGAFVASLNAHYSRWWSKANEHKGFEEISSQMSFNMLEALKAYRNFNEGRLPERVIIYRDGVGDGQLEHVFRVELTKVKEALDSADPNIKLTMIVVNKRIGARFYMRSGSEEAFGNPQPGTVVDHTVTREERYDFYLISQSTRQGTVTPTYYNIVHDENAFKPEIYQQLTFKLCLLYYNWSGTVRVPAPCQYAHKLAYLCGEHLHCQPNAQMDDKLHFL